MDLSAIVAAKDVAEIGERLLQIYKIGHDGSFYKKQEFLSRLREREAEIAAERAAADVADRDWRGLEITLASISQTDRLTRLLTTSPFRLSSEDTLQVAQEASAGGARPLLLEAPIGVDERASGFQGQDYLDLGVGQRWTRHPCAEDVQPLAGVIDRPLNHRDLDVHLIARSLSDLPAILIYGHVDGDNCLWLSICAWNIIASESGRQPMRLAFPRVDCPDQNEDPSATQEWREQLAAQATTIIALLAQWFFLIHHGRKPTLDKLSQLGHNGQMRSLLARQLVAAYEVLAYEGNSSTELRLDQAELFAEAGMHAQASVFALSLMDHIRQQSQRETDYPTLQRIVTLLQTIGDNASAAEAASLLETNSKAAVYQILGWVS